VLALDDARFEVRFQCARSLAAILEKNSALHVDRDHIYDVVVRAVTAASPVWESDRAMDGFVRESPLEEFVRDRASQSLAHVFTLLSLVLPRDPLRIAFRSLHSDDTHLRGTALEYLEGVLPVPIRERLWPFLGDATVQPRPARRQDDVIADLLRADPSITLKNIAERE
jgi:AAA family ATP:ADP antiporter